MSVVVERTHEQVVRLVLNRPERRNALDADQWEALTATLLDLASDPPGCLVLTGAGEAFASGGDLSRFRAELVAADGPRRFRERIRACLDALREFPAPTIASVNGPAIGGGFELAASCDVCVAVDTATFGMPAVSFGIVMAMPDLVHLVRAVGASTARYLTMTGRTIDAAEAHRIGLVHVLAAPETIDGEVDGLAARLVSVDRDAALWFREVCGMPGGVAGGGGPSTARIAQLRRHEIACLEDPALLARVDAFLERRR